MNDSATPITIGAASAQGPEGIDHPEFLHRFLRWVSETLSARPDIGEGVASLTREGEWFLFTYTLPLSRPWYEYVTTGHYFRKTLLKYGLSASWTLGPPDGRESNTDTFILKVHDSVFCDPKTANLRVLLDVPG